MTFLQRLFGKAPTDLEQSDPNGIETAPLDPKTIDWAALSNHTLVGTSQSTGVERAHNEDALFSLLGSSSGENSVPNFGLFVVADGMGGHRSGEVASALSVRSVAHRLSADPLLQLFDLNGSADSLPVQDLVRRALQDANKSVVSKVPGGGTTLTVVLVLGNQMTIGHVGDSRAYVLTQHETKVVTRDHSLVNRLVELGQLTEAEAAVHPQRNVLYKAVGQGANLEVDVETFPVPKNGFLLICSDGLWGVVPDKEIERIAWGADHPQAACDELIRAANAAGGPDNITAVLVYFPPT
ncbi:MAG: serine/threonine-protein phosphatase [Chloroflexi bacterium]|nr:serine/threonine-protein phosphatase [Chloroflexota bacterium]MDK1045516.1 protein phosphatase 2C domain-containing protein [Anaerolineales bacterium]MCH8875287.1 serine/threonine-protein phosphatase [Chloroflexota bacterium]MCI0772149.1 serine/threonine-protein phosphatase [Chloroflexota bacterium]MCI0805429.1 serine/threonine-protein phosphatase [Chloroflexota bacterium]